MGNREIAHSQPYSEFTGPDKERGVNWKKVAGMSMTCAVKDCHCGTQHHVITCSFRDRSKYLTLLPSKYLVLAITFLPLLSFQPKNKAKM